MILTVVSKLVDCNVSKLPDSLSWVMGKSFYTCKHVQNLADLCSSNSPKLERVTYISVWGGHSLISLPSLPYLEVAAFLYSSCLVESQCVLTSLLKLTIFVSQLGRLFCFLNKTPFLRSLTVEFYQVSYDLQEEYTQEMNFSLNYLRFLRIHKVDGLLSNLPQLPRLGHIILEEVTDFSFDYVNAEVLEAGKLVKRLPFLSTLRLKYCPNLEKMSMNNYSLKHLDIEISFLDGHVASDFLTGF
ncbi:hypothetical protein RCL1_009132 [Eukaryota sp. TZLM3-RCL]